MPTLTPAQYGWIISFVHIVIFSVAATVLHFLSNPENIAPIWGNIAAAIITMIAGSIEQHMKDTSGDAVFGAVRVSSSTSS